VPNYIIGGMRSPEDAIRGLVKNLSGYDMPNIPVGSFRSPSKAIATIGGNDPLALPGQGRFMQHLQAIDAANAQQKAMSRQAQMADQQMDHDRVKSDLMARGLIR
jgi:hypothetical protein